MGLAAARAAAEEAAQAGAVLVAGFGGACSLDWEVGSVGVGSRLLDPEGVWRDLDGGAHDRLTSVQAGRSALLATSRAAVDSPAERTALSRRGVDIVDMETAAWLGTPGSTKQRRVGCLRVVTDTLQSPLGVAATLVERGASEPSPLRLARLLILHPGALATLSRIGRSQRLATAALGRAVGLAVPAMLEAVQTDPEAALGEVFGGTVP
jgi:hypothetical protein